MKQPLPKDMLPFVLDEALAQVAVVSVQKSFATLFGAIVKPGTHRIEAEFNSKGDISGVLGMVQDETEATLIVSFRCETICKVMSKLYGKEFSVMDHSIKQGVGELTNIIYSMMKKALNERGFAFKIAIPSVMIGREHSVISQCQGKTLVIPFEVDGGTFHVEIARQPG